MARSRNIKPGLYENEAVASCSFPARWIFPGLWMLADREGRLEDRPMRIKAQLLPYDALSIGAVDHLLGELETQKLIKRYEIDEIKYIQVVNFSKHQNPHYREAQSLRPAPNERPKASVPPTHDSPQDSVQAQPRHGRATLIPDSLLLIPDSEKKERQHESLTTPPSREKKNQIEQREPDFPVDEKPQDWPIVIELWNQLSPVPVLEPVFTRTSHMERRRADRFAACYRQMADGAESWEVPARQLIEEAMRQPTIYGKPVGECNFGFFIREEVWKSVLQNQAAGCQDDGTGGLKQI